jgi:hypothetical protein
MSSAITKMLSFVAEGLVVCQQKENSRRRWPVRTLHANEQQVGLEERSSSCHHHTGELVGSSSRWRRGVNKSSGVGSELSSEQSTQPLSRDVK